MDFKNTPARQPPPGIKSNFIDPPSQVNHIILFDAIFLALMLLAVLVRVFVRVRVTRGWGWDDCKNSQSIRHDDLF